MKHLLHFFLALFSLTLFSSALFATPCQTQFTSCLGDCNISAHSFFRPRPISQDLSLEMALSQYNLYYNAQLLQGCGSCDDEHSWVDIQATPFYYQSTARKEIGEFFSPHSKEDFLIGQDNASDISSVWLELISQTAHPYSSVMSLRPERKAFGATFKLFFDLGTWLKSSCNCLGSTWLSIYVPVGANTTA